MVDGFQEIEIVFYLSSWIIKLSNANVSTIYRKYIPQKVIIIYVLAIIGYASGKIATSIKIVMEKN